MRPEDLVDVNVDNLFSTNDNDGLFNSQTDDVVNHLEVGNNGDVPIQESPSDFDIQMDQPENNFKECFLHGYEKRSVDQYIKNLKQQTLRVQSQLESAIKEISKEKNLLMSECNTLRQQVHDAAVRIDEDKETMLQYEDAIKTLQQQRQTAPSIDIKEIEQEIQNYIDEIEERDEKIHELEQSMQSLKEELRALEDTSVEVSDPKIIQQLKDEIDGLTFENNVMAKQLEDYKSKVEVKDEDGFYVTEAQIKEYEDSYKALFEAKKQLEETVVKMQEQLLDENALQEQLASLEDEVETLNEQLQEAALTSGHYESMIAELKDENYTLKEQLESAMDSSTEYEDEVKALNEKIGTYQSREQHYAKVVEKLKLELFETKKEKDSLHKEVIELKENLVECKEKQLQPVEETVPVVVETVPTNDVSIVEQDQVMDHLVNQLEQRMSVDHLDLNYYLDKTMSLRKELDETLLENAKLRIQNLKLVQENASLKKKL